MKSSKVILTFIILIMIKRPNCIAGLTRLPVFHYISFIHAFWRQISSAKSRSPHNEFWFSRQRSVTWQSKATSKKPGEGEDTLISLTPVEHQTNLLIPGWRSQQVLASWKRLWKSFCLYNLTSYASGSFTSSRTLMQDKCRGRGQKKNSLPDLQGWG